jgi:hypothetical protein
MTGGLFAVQLWRLIAAFGADPKDMNLLRRLVLVAQGGTVAYTFTCDDDAIAATRLATWDVWNRSLPHDRETLEVRMNYPAINCTFVHSAQ